MTGLPTAGRGGARCTARRSRRVRKVSLYGHDPPAPESVYLSPRPRDPGLSLIRTPVSERWQMRLATFVGPSALSHSKVSTPGSYAASVSDFLSAERWPANGGIPLILDL